jgi:hypothetical protein
LRQHVAFESIGFQSIVFECRPTARRFHSDRLVGLQCRLAVSACSVGLQCRLAVSATDNTPAFMPIGFQLFSATVTKH